MNPTLLPSADYNQSLNSPGALRRRLLKYVIPVIAFSVAFNIPKFFEAQIVVRVYLFRTKTLPVTNSSHTSKATD